MKSVLLDRALFVEQYPEIAAITFLAHDYVSRVNTSVLSELVLYVMPGVAGEILYVHEIIQQYADLEKLLIIVGEGAHVRVIYNQELSLFNTNVSMICYGAADSHVQVDLLMHSAVHAQENVSSAYTPAVQARVNLALHPYGKHAQMRVRGAYLLSKNQSAHVSVVQKHTVAHTSSDVVFKGIVQANAQALYEGLIVIDKKAPHTDAKQENKNIILGAQAVADSRPALEVLNNEVRCAHGSAVGPLDEQQLLYLTSRGLDSEQASRILLQAFLSDLFEQKSLLQKAITHKIQALFVACGDKNEASGLFGA